MFHIFEIEWRYVKNIFWFGGGLIWEREQYIFWKMEISKMWESYKSAIKNLEI